MKTREEIERLKADWLSDGCWDIEETEGFEDHEAELLTFRKKTEHERIAVQRDRLSAKAKDMGLSIENVIAFERAESKWKHCRANAQSLMLHYFAGAGIDTGGDTGYEIREMIDHIADMTLGLMQMSFIKELATRDDENGSS